MAASSASAVHRRDLADFAGLPVDALAQVYPAMQQADLLSGEQGGIPHETRVTEFHSQLLALGGVRVEAIFVCALCYHAQTIT